MLSMIADTFRPSPIPAPVLLPRGVSLLDDPNSVPAGFAHGVEILNDDTTPMEFVVRVLEKHFGLAEREAVRAMLEIHGRGGILMATATEEQASTIAEAIVRDAHLEKHSLSCRAVSAIRSAIQDAE